ncbi:MAG: DEAD/DEAH box helicase [Rhodospirillaceae bacterium]|nr:MAG: DEAD/DEAH box helicase [Rhodospirillaceae bacterium]
MAFPPTNPSLARALVERDYKDPTPVQTAVLAPEAAGRDLLVSAQTGSGKTVAFGLAIASTLLEGASTLPRAGDPLALIVAPTRELALQVHRELTWLYQHAGARVVTCVGGMDPRTEKHQLYAGCHIVVGTPGRLRDHLERTSLKIAGLKAVVLDEADEMLDLGFREDLEFILETTPENRRTLMFSATLPRDIVTLAKRYQRDALRIEASAGARGHADIEYRAMRIAPQDAVHAVVNVLRFVDSPATLVFCNTRDGVRHLHAALTERGFSAVSLSGEFSQTERNHALQALRDGRARVCVATDVAARGIDLPNLGLVIHADLPNDAETLQHRSGRTGRAGRKGVSVLIITPAHRRKAERLLTSARIQAVWTNPPTADDIRKLDNERLLQSLIAAESGQDEDIAMAKVLLTKRSPEDIAAALVRIYRSQLPAPEDVVDLGAVNTPGRPENAPREAKKGLADSVWFRLNVGRQRKADPKWLIPEICRQGGITKREIGAIRIFDQETKFEIDAAVAEQFSERIGKVTKGDIHIGPTEPPPDGGHARRPHAPPAGKDGWKTKTHGKDARGGDPGREPRDKPRWSVKAKYEGKPKFGGKYAGKPGGGFKKPAKAKK